MLSRYAFCASSIQSTLSHGKNEGARYTNMPMYQQLCVGYTPRLFILAPEGTAQLPYPPSCPVLFTNGLGLLP